MFVSLKFTYIYLQKLRIFAKIKRNGIGISLLLRSMMDSKSIKNDKYAEIKETTTYYSIA